MVMVTSPPDVWQRLEAVDDKCLGSADIDADIVDDNVIAPLDGAHIGVATDTKLIMQRADQDVAGQGQVKAGPAG